MPFIELFGHKMHYEEQGSGNAILLLHGNPSSGYSWRKVMPALAKYGRAIAIDHMGFGKSDKPHIEYSFFQHATFLEKFIEKMGLKNITLIIQDWGSALGFDYAARHEDNVRGIMFYEAIIKPFNTWAEFPKTDADDKSRDLFRAMRQGGKGGPGWKLNVEENVFITQLLPNLLAIPLPEAEMDEYRKPFKKPEWRIPIWRFVKEIPIAGDPADMTVTVGKYSAAMTRSNLPKLLIWSSSGATLGQEHVEWLRQNFRNLTIVRIGSGVHFFQDSNVNEFLQAFAEWFKKI
ncbi:MAG: haloalkane dehalogenase [Acidobacteria bacterium]|nr:haloalkane dehalogenase [Acidobacteriota bacterium]